MPRSLALILTRETGTVDTTWCGLSSRSAHPAFVARVSFIASDVSKVIPFPSWRNLHMNYSGEHIYLKLKMTRLPRVHTSVDKPNWVCSFGDTSLSTIWCKEPVCLMTQQRLERCNEKFIHVLTSCHHFPIMIFAYHTSSKAPYRTPMLGVKVLHKPVPRDVWRYTLITPWSGHFQFKTPFCGSSSTYPMYENASGWKQYYTALEDKNLEFALT